MFEAVTSPIPKGAPLDGGLSLSETPISTTINHRDHEGCGASVVGRIPLLSGQLSTQTDSKLLVSKWSDTKAQEEFLSEAHPASSTQRVQSGAQSPFPWWGVDQTAVFH